MGYLNVSKLLGKENLHEYDLKLIIRTWVEDEEIPNELEFLGRIVQDICYNNAYNYFQLAKRQ